MLSWMLYAIVVSLLIGLAALAFERSAHVRRRPARWLWGLGIIASLVIPFTTSRVSVRIPDMTRDVDPATSPKILAPSQTAAIELSRSAWSIAGSGQLQASRGADTLLVGAWPTASIALALVIIASGAHLSWRRRRWDRGHMAGTAVYLPSRLHALEPGALVATAPAPSGHRNRLRCPGPAPRLPRCTVWRDPHRRR